MFIVDSECEIAALVLVFRKLDHPVVYWIVWKLPYVVSCPL